MEKLSAADIFALIVFGICWLGYAPIVRRFVPDAINLGLVGLRISWMRTMLRRENRIVDSALLGHVVHSASFFTSTSLIVVGALLSLLSNADRVQPAVEQLAFVTAIPRMVFELKLALPLVVLIHGFACLTWSLRQLNYTIAMIGAAPERRLVAGEVAERLAQAIGRSLSAALSTFNTGIRAYYFAIGGLAWVIGPWALVVAAAAITGMLIWRQSYSTAARHFRAARAAMDDAHAHMPRE
ncbi:MAG: DUF599 family protein [Acetobacteraceae bacterium]|nr:DUF599 family protein [Acetobacteraceae bacterium]